MFSQSSVRALRINRACEDVTERAVMTKTCSVVGCNTNHKRRVNGKSEISNPGTVFNFPDEKRHEDLRRAWVRFCNRKDKFTISRNSGICTKHFDEKFIKDGSRKTLKWAIGPVPTKFSADVNVPLSVLPTPTSHRKPPTDRSSPDEMPAFRQGEDIKGFSEITDAVCPAGFKLEVHDAGRKRAIFYKMETNSIGIPEVTQTIVIDEQLHVKLYKNSLPIPLPKWFTKGGDCKAKKKSIIQEFPTHIKNFGDTHEVITSDPKKMPGEILEELNKLRYKKPDEGPKFSPNLLRYALLLYYTSPQGYRLLLEQFPFPSVIYLKKLSQGGVEALKACTLLLEKGMMDKDVILMLDEIFLQKDEAYQGGHVIGSDKDGNLFKGITLFTSYCLIPGGKGEG